MNMLYNTSNMQISDVLVIVLMVFEILWGWGKLPSKRTLRVLNTPDCLGVGLSKYTHCTYSIYLQVITDCSPFSAVINFNTT